MNKEMSSRTVVQYATEGLITPIEKSVKINFSSDSNIYKKIIKFFFKFIIYKV